MSAQFPCSSFVSVLCFFISFCRLFIFLWLWNLYTQLTTYTYNNNNNNNKELLKMKERRVIFALFLQADLYGSVTEIYDVEIECRVSAKISGVFFFFLWCDKLIMKADFIWHSSAILFVLAISNRFLLFWGYAKFYWHIKSTRSHHRWHHIQFKYPQQKIPVDRNKITLKKSNYLPTNEH